MVMRYRSQKLDVGRTWSATNSRIISHKIQFYFIYNT